MAGGTGLGLYSLSRRIEALGGQYGVHGRKDGKQGSAFWLSFPYRPDHMMSTKDPEASPLDTSIHSIRGNLLGMGGGGDKQSPRPGLGVHSASNRWIDVNDGWADPSHMHRRSERGIPMISDKQITGSAVGGGGVGGSMLQGQSSQSPGASGSNSRAVSFLADPSFRRRSDPAIFLRNSVLIAPKATLYILVIEDSLSIIKVVRYVDRREEVTEILYYVQKI